MESITLCLTKRKQVHPGDWSSPTPRVSIKTQIHKLFIDTDFLSICCGSGFRSGSRTIFSNRSIWEMAVPLYQASCDLGSNDKLTGFGPHTVCLERFMLLPVVLYRICASVLWERCNELMLEICRLLRVFFFSFQALLLIFFLGSFLLLNFFAFLEKWSLTIIMTCYYFWGASLNYQHPCMSYSGTEPLEDIIKG